MIFKDLTISFMVFLILGQGAISMNKTIQIINIGARFPKLKNITWNQKPGKLNIIGLRQLYILGQSFREKYIYDYYNPLLSRRYGYNETLFRAAYSNSTSAVSSAYALIRGLYPPGTGQFLTDEEIKRAIPPFENFNYKEYEKELRDAAIGNYLSSIPVIVNAGGPDYALSAAENCPRLKTIIPKNDKKLNSTIRAIEERAKKIYNKLSKYFGVKVNSIDDFDKYREYILAAKYYGIDTELDDCMETLNEVYWLKNYQILFYYIDHAKVVTNYILKEVVKSITEHGNIKMIAYFVEDKVLYAMARLFNDWNKYDHIKNVTFASCIQIDYYSGSFLDKGYFNITLDGKPLSDSNRGIFVFSEFMKIINNTLNDEEFAYLCGLKYIKEIAHIK